MTLKLYMVSFSTAQNSYNTLMVSKGQRPTAEQCKLLKQYLNDTAAQPVTDDGSDLV